MASRDHSGPALLRGRLLEALLNRDEGAQLAVIDEIRQSGDTRCIRQLWLLTRYHLVSEQVRTAARDTLAFLQQRHHNNAGQISEP